jgi:hypothetical protein
MTDQILGNPHIMQRTPVDLPAVPGVFALTNRRRRFVYIAWTSNLMKRSHAMASMLKTGRGLIRGLPVVDGDGARIPPGEYNYILLKAGVDAGIMRRSIAQLQRPYVEKGYTLVGGCRDPQALVDWHGEDIDLVEAIARAREIHSSSPSGGRSCAAKASKPKLKYTTVWRRLQRGWTLDQALEFDAPPPKWGH